MPDSSHDAAGEPDPSEELGRLVRIRRKELGLTVENCVRLSGLSRSSWQGVESARAKHPLPATLRSVDGALRWKLGTSSRILSGDGVEPEAVPERDTMDLLKQLYPSGNLSRPDSRR